MGTPFVRRSPKKAPERLLKFELNVDQGAATYIAFAHTAAQARKLGQKARRKRAELVEDAYVKVHVEDLPLGPKDNYVKPCVFDSEGNYIDIFH